MPSPPSRDRCPYRLDGSAADIHGEAGRCARWVRPPGSNCPAA